MKKILFVSLIMVFLSHASFALDIACDVCGMEIKENASNHFILKKEKEDKEALHVCSIPCVIKGKKNSPQFSRVEVSDFNQPGKFLDGNQAFFLVRSKSIKKDLGDMVMPPYVAAFSTKKEATVAQKKYGDGMIVKGFDNVLKEVK